MPRSAAVGDDLKAEPAVGHQVLLNQARTAEQWSETAEDMAINRLVRHRDDVRLAHVSIVLAALVVLCIFVLGFLWTRSEMQRDGMLAAERARSQQVYSAPGVPQ